MPAIHAVALQTRIKQFLAFCAVRDLSPNTIKAYSNDLSAFAALMGPNPTTRRINRKLLRRFMARLHESGLARASIVRHWAAVKSFCNWLQAEGVLDWSLIELMPPRRRRQALPDVPSQADMKRLLDGKIPGPCPERDRVILELLYSGGLRCAEVVGVNVDDHQEADTLLVRGKGKKERMVVLGEPAQSAIQMWLPVRERLLKNMKLDTEALLFSVANHRSIERLDVRTIGRVVKAVASARGFDPAKWYPHLLRHACGTHCHENGMPLQAVAQLLGHARLSTAQIYTRVSVGRMMQTYSKAHPHARFPHVGRGKRRPRTAERENCPSCATALGQPPEHGGMRGLAVIVSCINYMGNSLGKVKQGASARGI